MGKKKTTKGNPRTARRSTVTDLPMRRLRTGQARGIKGGARRTKNEVAIETLEIAHEGLSP